MNDNLRADDLGETFKRLIRENGPISLAQYMGESNARYYTSRNPLGDDGDFITAPEVSQVFGELIGLWLADIWVRAGTPEPIHYVELGPGRGTLASDALRAAERYGLKPQVHFVEGSEALKQIQRGTVRGVTHHADVTTLPEDGPLLIVANEFFDALPVRQLLRAAEGWRERMVGLESDKLAFVFGDKPMDAAVPQSWRQASQGTIIETSPASAAIMSELADRLAAQGGAALVIDYGPREGRSGSTLQAIKGHQKVDVFSHPGNMDLTAHVDFETLAKVAQRQGAQVLGLQMQGDWLTALGIDMRMEALKRRAPGQAETFKRQHDRLVAEDQMGLLFKVLGLSGKDWPEEAPGF
jgi:SAM-dependent MidA family methyltransferase